MKIEKRMKAKGFKFESREGLSYNVNMERYDGVEGIIGEVWSKYIKIVFSEDCWFYPIEEAHKALLSVGDKVKIPKTKSVGDSIEDSNVIKDAIRNGIDYLYYTGATIDGRLMLNDKDKLLTGDYFRLEDVELYEKENKMEIKKSELEKIYNVACSTWQGKIKEMANRNAFGDSVELTQEEIDIMFIAATPSQTEVLEEVFGKQNKEIDLRHTDITAMVDGIPLFGGTDKEQNDVFISLPSECNNQNVFFLNSNYDWKLEGKKLTVTRK